MADRPQALLSIATFGDLLKALRRRARLTQRELSITVGYSEPQISRFEANLRIPDKTTLLALFVPALGLEEESALVARLLELARATHAGISENTDPLLPDAPAPAPASHPAHNLPLALTSFIGRETEIAEIMALLTSGPARLVTLTGAGGLGKTRLALQTAGGLLDHFPDGVWLVELAALSNPDLVPEAVARSISAPAGLEAIASLVAFIAAKKLLLVLDNCEHLVSAAARLAEHLLQACPNLQVLATSREILGIPGEMVYTISPFSISAENNQPSFVELAQLEAVQLFTDRARSVSNAFQITATNIETVAQICRRLDGIPLAIELAAARVRLLSIEQIDAHLDDAFRLLTAGSRTALPRHQTLEACIAWSYDLLLPQEQALFRRLSVFSGGWTLEAAEQVVCDNPGSASSSRDIEVFDVLGLLGQLVDKSLVLPTPSASGQPRYRMLETIRQYGSKKLQDAIDTASTRSRHLEYFTRLAIQAESHLRAPDQRAWLDRLDEEIDNLRQAIAWALEGSLEPGMQLATALHRFWMVRVHQDGFESLGQLLIADGAWGSEHSTNPVVRARALNTYACFFGSFRDRGKALAFSSEARNFFETAGPDFAPDLALSLITLADLSEDVDQGIALAERSLDLLKSAPRDFSSGSDFTHEALETLFKLLVRNREIEKARQVAEELLAYHRVTGDIEGVSLALNMLGWIAFITGHLDRARAFYEDSVAAATQNGETGPLIYYSFRMVTMVTLSQGDPANAIARLGAEAAEARKAGRLDILPGISFFLAWSFWALGDYVRALACCPEESFHPDAHLDINFIRGRVALSRGDYLQAEAFLKNAAVEINGPIYEISYPDHPTKVWMMLGVSALRLGHPRRAVQLFSAHDHLDVWMINALSLPERTEYEQALADARTALGDDAFTAAWAEGQALTFPQFKALALSDGETLT